MKRNLKSTFGAIVLALLCLASTAGRAGDLIVEISNIKPSQGTIRLEVIDKAGYQSDAEEVPGIATATHPADGASLRLTLTGIPSGEYAVQVFQDLNDNQELDFSFLSGPEEPIGFSNNVAFGFGPPDWDKLKITLTEAEQILAIKLTE